MKICLGWSLLLCQALESVAARGLQRRPPSPAPMVRAICYPGTLPAIPAALVQGGATVTRILRTEFLSSLCGSLNSPVTC